MKGLCVSPPASDDMSTGADRPEATITQVVEGPVTTADHMYAIDAIRSICRAAPGAVRRVRVGLSVQPQPTGETPGTAECSLLIDGTRILCAGVAASTVREAVNALVARLLRRLEPLMAASGSRLRVARDSTAAGTADPPW